MRADLRKMVYKDLAIGKNTGQSWKVFRRERMGTGQCSALAFLILATFNEI